MHNNGVCYSRASAVVPSNQIIMMRDLFIIIMMKAPVLSRLRDADELKNNNPCVACCKVTTWYCVGTMLHASFYVHISGAGDMIIVE